MTINSIEISLREQTATISLFAGCGGSNVSSIVCADSKEAVSEYKKLSKSHNPKLWEENRDNLLIDQGDRSLIFYFERGRDSGVKATSVFSSG